MKNPLNRALSWRRGLAVGAVGLGLLGPAAAQTLQGIAQAWLDTQTAQWQTSSAESGKAPVLRPQIEVGMLDPRLQLAACQHVQPYLPAQTKLWGRSRIGLRCTQGAVRWNVFLPIQVKVWGPAWVAKQAIPSGTALTQDMLETAEIDWAERTAPVMADLDDLLGRETVHPITPGVALRQGMVRAPEVFATGGPVRVQVQGKGFSLTAEGKALGPGRVGQAVRIRMPSGRVVVATATVAGWAELPP